jgi:hypothetical protein
VRSYKEENKSESWRQGDAKMEIVMETENAMPYHKNPNFKETARVQFVSKCQEKLERLINARPFAVDSYLSIINRVVEAGRAMGVTEAENFTKAEIAQIVHDISPLAELEMYKEVREYLLPLLTAKNLGDEILAPFTAKSPAGQ